MEPYSIFLQYFIFELEAHFIKSQFNVYFRYMKLFQNHIYEYLKSVMKSYSDEIYYPLTSIFLIDFYLSFCKCFLGDTLLNSKRSFISNESCVTLQLLSKQSPKLKKKKKSTSKFQSKCSHSNDNSNYNNNNTISDICKTLSGLWCCVHKYSPS